MDIPVIIEKINKWPFLKARRFVRSLGLKCIRDWKKWYKCENRPSYIPSNPVCLYKKEWISFYDWLGTKPIKKISFNKSLVFMRKINLRSYNDWLLYRSSGKKPTEIPSNPYRVYGKKWRGFPYWLGYKYNIRTYNVNHNYFKKWSHNMAYILGLWWADGCIHKNQFIISLHVKDKYLLQKILKTMNSNNKIHERKKMCEISINSSAIVADIKKIGGVERKSLVIKFPKIPHKYLHDFVRGYFDGDGSIYFLKSYKHYGSSFCSGSKKFIYKLQKILKNKKIVCGGSLSCVLRKNIIAGNKSSSCDFIYSLRYSKNDTIRLKKFMYKNDSLKMTRKYDLFLKTGEMCSRGFSKKYLDFNVAKEIVKKIKLQTKKEWFRYHVDNAEKLIDIPYNPSSKYRCQGWVDWYDWLGKKRPLSKLKTKRIGVAYGYSSNN